MGFSDFIQSTGGGAAIGAASSLLGAGLNLFGQKSAEQRQFEYWQKQHEIMREEQLQDYARQKRDSYQFLLDSPSLNKEGLRNAGISTSMANGQFQLAHQPQQGYTEGSLIATANPRVGDAFGNFAQNLVLGAQIRNLEADTNKKKNEADKTASEKQKIDQELQAYITQVLPTQIAEANARIERLAKENNWTDKQIEQANQQIAVLERTVKQFDINLETLKEENRARINQINAATDDLKASKGLKEAQTAMQNVLKGFAEMGIGVGHGMVDQIAALLTQPDGGKMVDTIFDNLLDMIDKVIDRSTEVPRKVLEKAKGKLIEVKDTVVSKAKQFGKEVVVDVKKGYNKLKEADEKALEIQRKQLGIE